MERSEKMMKAQEIYDQAKLEEDIERLIKIYDDSPDHKKKVKSIYDSDDGVVIYFEGKEENK